MIGEALSGAALVVAVQAVFAALSWLVLWSVRRRPALRVVLLGALWLGYHAALPWAVPSRSIFLIGVVFAVLHIGFVFRFASQIYFYRRGDHLPQFLFHVALLVIGPRQHYGAAGWDGLRGVRFGRALLREWSRHLPYNLAVIAISAAAVWWLLAHDPPLRLFLLGSAAFILGLELITLLANLVQMIWSLWGFHPRVFFGNFTWVRSRHVGQFWLNWNRLAYRAFQEWIDVLGLQRRRFLGTMAVFVASGVIHEGLVFMYTRRPSYGAFLAFVIHGMLVFLFGELFQRRGRMPRPLRYAVFNPLTSFVVTLLASQPLVMDFYGRFAF